MNPSQSAISAIFHGEGEPFEVIRTNLRTLRQGEILVRNEFTTLCRSDVNTYCGKRIEKTPTILGHEIVGQIVEFASGAPDTDARGSKLSTGDRVTWAIYAADPTSELAMAGIPQKSPDLFKYGHEQVTDTEDHHGGLSEFCILRRHTPLVKLSSQVPLKIAALINCSAATVAGAMRLAGDVSGKRILITGAGMLGVFACAMSRIAGAGHILAADINADRLKSALLFGADDTEVLSSVLDASRCGPLVDVHLDFSGVPETMEASIYRLGIGGVSVLVGATYPQRDIHLNAELLVRRLVTIRGLHNYNQQDLIRAVDFVEAHHAQFPFTDLVDDSFSLSEVNEAFAHAHSTGVYRVGIHTTANSKIDNHA